MEEPSHNDHLIDLAKEFAADKFQQAGVGNHFLEVYKILKNEFGIRDQEVLVAGLLHDTLEDTDATPEEIEKAFSKRIVDLVLEVSHPKDYTQEQRIEYYEKLNHISSDAKMVKLADFVSNLRIIINVYESGKQHLHPKFVNNDKYISSIRGFLESCEESNARKVVTELINELENYL